MCCEGNIEIYDLTKFKEKYPNASELIDIVKSATVYIQTMQGKEYLTHYYGDNISDRSDLLYMLRAYKDHMFDTNDIHYDGSQELWLRKNYYLKQIEQLSEMARYLVQECYLTDWEVWT